MLTQTRLPCGCLCLCDADGPCCVLEPCADYPKGGGDDLTGVEDWAEQLAARRRAQKKSNRKYKARRRRRKAQ